jgi:hypothetical protein
MGNRNASRPGGTGGGDRGESQLHASEHVAAGREGPAARVGSRGRRSPCAPDGEPAGPGELAGKLADGGARARRADTRASVLDREALDVLIVQQWTKTLRGPYDWGDWPLARYTLGEDVLRAVERRASGSTRCADPAATRLAWVCAMVACGRAPRLRSIAPSPLGGAADAEQLVRADGARGWRCNVERDAPNGPQLHYWVHPGGLVEFETIVASAEHGAARGESDVVRGELDVAHGERAAEDA